MTVKVKFTKFEWELVELLRARTEPMRTREIQTALQLHTPAGVIRTLEQLERRGLVTSSLVMDGLERAWKANP